MGQATKIQWTEKTWNPVTGCDKVSPGCANCYAEAMTKRFKHAFPQGFNVTLHSERLSQPLKWRKPSLVFVNSMSDLFHDRVPLEFIQQIFDVMGKADHHTFQILTKRPQRMLDMSPQLIWHPNIWMGVSVESQKYCDRVDILRQVPAAIRFLSCEPLLGPLELDLTDIHWVIVGGESGTKHRPVKEEWATDIRDQCLNAKVPFFFKQWGTAQPKNRELQGKLWDEMPLASKT